MYKTVERNMGETIGWGERTRRGENKVGRETMKRRSERSTDTPSNYL